MLGIKLFKIFSSNGVPQKLEQSINQIAKTKVRTDLNTGTVYMERVFKGNLYKTETKVLNNGAKKTITKVYDSEGNFIGKGGSEGLSIFREKEIKVNKGGSILGGDQIEIQKKYHETMSMTEHDINITKDFDSSGTLQHMEGTKKYRHWSNAQKATIDKVWVEESLPHSTELMFNPQKAAHTNYKHDVSAYDIDGVRHNGYNNYHLFNSEGTSYTRAQEALKAAAAEKEAALIAEANARKIAEQKASEALKAKQPRVNVGKVFNKNLSEFKCVESTQPDGTIIRRYYDPKRIANGKSNPMITTKDKGSYHEELIYDPIKDTKITYKQLGNKEPEIEMTEGMQYRYSSKIEVNNNHGRTTTRRVDKQVYDDGLNHVEFETAGYPERFKVNVKNPKPNTERISDSTWDPDYADIRGRRHVGCRDLYSGQNSWEIAAQKKLNEISNEAQEHWKNLMDFFKPYQP